MLVIFLVIYLAQQIIVLGIDTLQKIMFRPHRIEFWFLSSPIYILEFFFLFFPISDFVGIFNVLGDFYTDK